MAPSSIPRRLPRARCPSHTAQRPKPGTASPHLFSARQAVARFAQTQEAAQRTVAVFLEVGIGDLAVLAVYAVAALAGGSFLLHTGLRRAERTSGLSVVG